MKVFFVICVLMTQSELSTSDYDNKFNFSQKEPIQSVCLSDECNEISTQMLLSMDTTVNPCDDFYKYACGNWTKSLLNSNSSNDGARGTSDLRQQKIMDLVQTILERNTSKGQTEAEIKAKRFYTSCIDEKGIVEELKEKLLVEILEKIGGWSISPSGFVPENWNFESKLEILHNEYNLGVVFGYEVDQDLFNSSNHIIMMKQVGLILPSVEYYLNSTYQEIRKLYLEYMVEVAVLLGAKNDTNTRNGLQEIIEFEIELAKIIDPEIQFGKFYKIYNISMLYQLAPIVSWRDFFNVSFARVGKEINDDQIIGNLNPQFFSKLSKLVVEKLKTSKGKIILNNYMVWQLVHEFVPHLSKEFRDAKKKLNLKAKGVADSGEDCRYNVKEFMGEAFGLMFIREAYPFLAKPYVESMFKECKSVLVDLLSKVEWMDNVARAMAQEKVEAMTYLIGHPEVIREPEIELYKDLEILENDYIGNVLRAKKFQVLKNLNKLGAPIGKYDEWLTNAVNDNAYYHPQKNHIEITAPNFISPYFHTDLPKSINYGRLCFILGHELTHGFDPNRINFDKFGNLNPWIQNSDLAEIMNCLVKQMSGPLTIDGINVTPDGMKTLDENFADTGGIKIAFEAYQKSKSKDPSLPGLNHLSQNQLFFLSFAQAYCYSYIESHVELRNEILTDSHSPSTLRIRASLSNLPEFSKTYNCPLGSPMNPVKKCTIW